MTQLIDAATNYAKSGRQVFPLWPRTKKPITKHGVNDASGDTNQVQRWWNTYPSANIAIACGAASGIIVIDLDAIDETNTHDGQVTWQRLTAHYGEVETRQQKTGGGGRQLFFVHPGTEISNRAQLLPGIDVRGDGGYTVVSPSIHPTGNVYEWINDLEPQQPPTWLLSALFGDPDRLEALRVALPDEAERQAWSKKNWSKSPELAKPMPSRSIDGPTFSANSDEMKRWLTVTMQKAYDAVASAPKGQRNAVLNRETYSLAGLIPYISRVEIERLMFMAAEKSDYVADDGEASVMAAIKSAIDSGMKSPRQLPALTPARPAVVIPAMDNDDAGFVPSDDTGQGEAVQVKAAPQPAQRPAREPKQPTPLAIVAGDELYDREYPPRQFLVDGLIKRGDCVLLAGRPKSGKSWLLLQLAQHIDTGLPFIGKATTKASVLYLALEDGDQRIHERQHIRKWKPKQAAFGFGIMPLSEGGMEQLENAAQGFDVIVIDTLRAACGGEVDENDNAQMGAIMQDLANFAHRSQKTVIVTHHTRKGESEDTFDLIRGAGAIRGAYDVGLVVQRKAKEAEAVLHVESRDVEADDMTLRFDGATGWSYEGDAGKIELIRAGRGVIKALKALDKECKTEDVAEFMNVSKEAARQQLIKAHSQGLVLRNQVQGSDKAKKSDVWSLSPDGERMSSQK